MSKRVFLPVHGDCPYQPQWFVSDCHMQPQLDDQTDQAGNPESQTYGGKHRKAWISGEGRKKTLLIFSTLMLQHCANSTAKLSH